MKKIFAVIALALALTAGLTAMNAVQGKPAAQACEASGCS